MGFKKYVLFIKEKVCEIIHKDPMKYRLERYRMNGAIIGENVRAFSPICSSEDYLIKVGNNRDNIYRCRVLYT